MLYLVDKSNCIVDVDDEWNITANRSGEGCGLDRERVIGYPLESFMVGDATKMFVRAALDAARLRGETRVLPYRCDTPLDRRTFNMFVSPLDNDLVKVEHKLVEAMAIPPRGKRSRPPALPLWRCSQCFFVRFAGNNEWVDTFVEPSAILAQDICQACSKRLFDTPPSA